mgnify:CR=1 FL=1
MTQPSKTLSEFGPSAIFSTNTQPEEDSELSAQISEVEPETTATAARSKQMASSMSKTKRSYKTVDPTTRKQLVHMVHVEQKTIKEAANRL